MLNNPHFYHRTMRKVVVAFGTIFNDLYVIRQSSTGQKLEKFKVPLNYGGKEKYIIRLTTDPTLTKSIATMVPRISFELTGMAYDESRKLPSMIRNFSANTSTSINTQFVPVPYNYSFSMSIYVRNTEDASQILEQILPFFTPDYTVTLDFIPSMAHKYDMLVILNSVSSQIDYEGDMSTTRLIIWNLEFTAKGYIWPPVQNAEVIRQANTSIYYETSSRNSQKVYVANGVGYLNSTETIRVANRGVTGQIVYFSNNDTGVLVVDNLNKLLEANDVVVGDFTNASYRVTSIDTNPLKSVLVVTQPAPNTALPNQSFGFSETISEYPQVF